MTRPFSPLFRLNRTRSQQRVRPSSPTSGCCSPAENRHRPLVTGQGQVGSLVLAVPLFVGSLALAVPLFDAVRPDALGSLALAVPLFDAVRPDALGSLALAVPLFDAVRPDALGSLALAVPLFDAVRPDALGSLALAVPLFDAVRTQSGSGISMQRREEGAVEMVTLSPFRSVNLEPGKVPSQF